MFNRSLASRRVFALLVSSIVAVTISASAAFGQTTAFTYQGRLTDGSNPANGAFDMEFKLFDLATVGNQQGPTVTSLNVVVSAGTFSVQLDFGVCTLCFPGAKRYLEISLKPAGDPAYTTLSPRQQILSAPYSLKSANATAADSLSSFCINCVTSSQIASVNGNAVTGPIPASSVPAGSENYIQNTTTQQASSNFNISGNGVVGGSLGIGTSTPSGLVHVRGASPVRILGDTSTLSGSEFVDFFARSSIFASDLGGMRIQRQPANGNIDTLIFGAPSGSSATEVMRVSGNGNVGIGTTTPAARLAVRGDGTDVVAGSAGCGPPTAAIGFGAMSGCTDFALGGNVSTGAAAGTFLNRPAGRSLHFRENNGPDQMTIVPGGNVGIGTTDPSNARLVVQGNLQGGLFTATDDFGTGVRARALGPTLGLGVSGSGTSMGVEGSTTSGIGVFGSTVSGTGVEGSSSTGVAVYGHNNGAGLGGPALRAENSNPNGVGIWSISNSNDANLVISNNGSGDLIKGFCAFCGGPSFRVQNNGTTVTTVLQITGGSDLAEHFEVAERVKPGMVVAIDPKNAGKLSIARGAYNRRAAGVISGAKNLSAGMVLPDVSGAKQSVPVALSGRVWVYCDANRNPIKPGDLLTTSVIPGHAMKATNHAKAQGAIIGKAMSGLKAGRGLVLVLVTLQ